MAGADDEARRRHARARVDTLEREHARADRARPRGARGGAGPQLLARPLGRRPERADAQPRRRPACARALRALRGWSRGGTRCAVARCASAGLRASSTGSRCARSPAARGTAAREFERVALARPAALLARDRPALRAPAGRGRGRRRGARSTPRRARAARRRATRRTAAACCSPSPSTTRSTGVLERTGLDAGDAARGRARDGARRRGRGRLPLLRRPGRRRLRGRAGFEPGAARTTGLDFGCSSGRAVRVARGRVPGRGVARLRPDRRRDRVGAGEHPGRRVPPQPRAAAAALRRRVASTRPSRSRSGRTSPSRPPRAGSRRCSRLIRPGGRAARDHARRADDRPHDARGAAARRRAARPACASRSTRHGFWFADEFGEAGDHGVTDPDWGTAFLTAEWLLAKRHPGLEGRRALPPGPGRGQPGPVRARAALEPMRSVSVVIPVKDGGALPRGGARRRPRPGRRRAPGDRLGVDATARPDLARAAGADLIEIRRRSSATAAPATSAAERTSGELICFLTQDAVPEPGLAGRATARRSSSIRGWARRSGRTCRCPDTSPMIARELTEFFAGFSPNGGAGAPARAATSRSSRT